jgi:gag-polypeptide of LTR copia-type
MTPSEGQATTTPDAATNTQPAPLPTSIKLEKFDVLTEDSYETWARTARANLVVGGYWPFFSGKRPKPKQDSKDWERFNLQLVACLQTRMHPTLQHHLDDIETAEQAWEKLRRKFREKGTVGQLNLLWTALRTRFTRSSPKAITESIHELNGVINQLFEIRVPTQEEWKAMFFLHALGDDGDFEMMREMLETLVAT